MKSLKTYSIPFTGLKLGKHQFDFEINEAFFDQFEYSLVKKGALNCRVELDKQETMLILNFEISGTIDLSCDRCLAEYPQQINIAEQQIAKFSDEDIDNEDIITLTKNDHEIDIGSLVYEYINVGVPFITVCDNEGNTTYCDTEMLERINKLSAGNEEQNSNDDVADPRWDALKKFK